MNPTELKTAIKAAHRVRRSVCIEGPPGIGKTQIVEQAARELGIPCIVKHLPTMLVEDFGILFPQDAKEEGNTLTYRLPDWFPRQSSPEGILLFDDRNQGGHCLLYTSPSPRDRQKSRMPSSA